MPVLSVGPCLHFFWILLLNVQRVGFMVHVPKTSKTTLNVIVACIKTWFTVPSVINIAVPAKSPM